MSIKQTIAFCISCFFVAQSYAGSYGDAIDAQSGAMGQVMKEFSAIQSNNAAYWRSMPKRRRFILRTTNTAVRQYKKEFGRYPTINNREFVRYVFEKVGIQDNKERDLVVYRIQRSSKTYEELDD